MALYETDNRLDTHFDDLSLPFSLDDNSAFWEAVRFDFICDSVLWSSVFSDDITASATIHRGLQKCALVLLCFRSSIAFPPSWLHIGCFLTAGAVYIWPLYVVGSHLAFFFESRGHGSRLRGLGRSE